jgi:hypothetical protein
MGRFSLALAAGFLLIVSSARADDKCPTPARQATVTWGVTNVATPPEASTPAVEDTPVGKARDLMARAKLLDEAAGSDERTVVDLLARLPIIKTSAKAARDRADKSTGDDRVALASRADELETDVTVSEAEIAEKRKAAAENRRLARELRARAVKIVREGVVEDAMSCDPPFRFTADGRKIYRLECLK